SRTLQARTTDRLLKSSANSLSLWERASVRACDRKSGEDLGSSDVAYPHPNALPQGKGVRNPKPKLVLLIVVDQFRYEYLTRFGDLFGTHGIGRLMRDGAVWTNANFDISYTVTASGHSVFMSGAWPSKTGIVANEWYERETGKKVKS